MQAGPCLETGVAIAFNRQAANDLRAMLDSGDFGKVREAKAKPTLMTIQEMSARLIGVWRRKIELGNISRKTVEDYCYWLNRLVLDFGSKLLYEITAEEVVLYRDLIARRTSNVTANRYLFILKQVTLFFMVGTRGFEPPTP